MIKIMDDSKALDVLLNDTSNGLGQINALTHFVDEELNGIYEGYFTVLITDKHFSDLKVGGIIKSNVNDTDTEQLFRIYYISKAVDGTCEVRFQHITYDLVRVPVKPFESTGAVATKNAILNNIIGQYPFNMTTDIENNTSKFTLDIPRSFRECLGGYEGSILDVFRCEYQWDNLTVKMLSKRGHDNGVRIAYGKNLTDFKQEENIESVYTSVLGYAVVNEVAYVGNIYHKINVKYPKVKIIDFSSDYENEETPTVEDLTAKAKSYADSNDIEVPNVNLTISFLNLAQTDEYKNIMPLERVSLGDTVHVYFEKLGVEASARVIKTTYNCLLNKYESIELGSAKANLNSVISNAVDEGLSEALNDLDLDTSFIENELNEMTSLIINGLGLRKTVDEAGRIFLHNAETLAESQYQYIITAQGFMMSNDYGQTWNSGWDTSGNAVMNALSTITLKALEIYGSYIQGSTIVFGDMTDKYIIASPYQDSNGNPVGVLFNGTGQIRMTPEGQFNVQNLVDGVIYNQQLMTYSQSAGNQIYFANNTEEGKLANMIRLGAHRTFNDTYGKANAFVYQNYCYDDSQYIANLINFISTSSSNETYPSNNKMFISNRKYGVSLQANEIDLTSSPSELRIDLYNYQIGMSAYANRLNMVANASENSIRLQNNRLQTSGTVNATNYLLMKSNANENQTIINNMYFGNDSYLGNQLYMYSQTDYNIIALRNYKNNNSNANTLELKNQDSKNSATLGNYIYTSSTGGYGISNRLLLEASQTLNSISLGNSVYNQSFDDRKANELLMQSNSSGNSLELVNYQAPFTKKNALQMSSDSTTTLWSASDLRLRSSGAIRAFANCDIDTANDEYYKSSNGGTQDIYLGGYSVKIQCSDKIYLYWGSTRVYLTRVQYQGINVIGYKEA